MAPIDLESGAEVAERGPEDADGFAPSPPSAPPLSATRFDSLLRAFLSTAHASSGSFWSRIGDEFVLQAPTTAPGTTDRVPVSGIQGWEPRWFGDALILPLRVDDVIVGIVRLESVDSTPETYEATCALADVTARALISTYDVPHTDFAKEPESGCYPLAFFMPHVEKEVARARRYHRMLALAYATLDNFDELLATAEQRLVRGAARRLMRAIQAVVRDSDVVTRPRDAEFAVLLTETDSLGGYSLARRLRNLYLRGEVITRLVEVLPLNLSIGVASFPYDATSGEELISRARQRAQQHASSIIRRFGLEFQSIWDILSVLLKDGDHYAHSRSGRLYLHPTLRPFDDPDGITRHDIFSKTLVDEIIREVAHEVSRRSHQRGNFVLLETEPSVDIATEAFASLVGSQTRVTYLVGYPVGLQNLPHVSVVPLDRANLPETRLCIYFGEGGSYSVASRVEDPHGLFGFHSTDPLLAELLVSRVYETYRISKGAA
ncbi:MAG: diguanylate cyclase [Deltaproteobacteria bacterium]|nr:diguanylate cyclase [Deltaproteobacteria bacterium]